jgi:GTP-binding protein
VLSKIDTLDPEERAFLRDELQEASGGPVMLMSAVSGEGVAEVLRALRAEIGESRTRRRRDSDDEIAAAQADEGTPWQP